jgi:fatty acid desaturase
MKANDLLEADEIRAFTAPSDLAGARAVLTTWAMIAGAFALCAWRPGVLTFAIAVIVLGGRQLALAVLMHEAAHRTLFRTRWMNDVVVDAVCARVVWADVARYRAHHLAHHAHAGTDRDPDRSLVAPFPVSRRSLARKLARDVFGIAGVRRAIGLVLMDAGFMTYAVSGEVEWLPRRAWWWHAKELVKRAGPTALANGALLALLWACGATWVYAAWVVAWLTTYGLFLRVRSMAEHACLDGGRDPLHNTRTTHAGWLARLTVAPHAVGYHLEHHLLPTVPYFRLRALHTRVRAQVPARALAGSYADVLRIVSARA